MSKSYWIAGMIICSTGRERRRLTERVATDSDLRFIYVKEIVCETTICGANQRDRDW